MREIEFRGKRIDNHEWIYGYCTYNDARRRFEIDGVFVNPHSIGQYIGLKDKNGRKIFEQDIFRDLTGELCYITWFEDTARYLGETPAGEKVECFCRNSVIEILGNSLDNPELDDEMTNKFIEYLSWQRKNFIIPEETE